MLAKQFFDPADIRNNPLLGGGALYDLGSYAISGFNLIFGRAPLRVTGVIDRDPAFGVDRLTTAILDYGDAQATLTVSSQAGGTSWATQQHAVGAGRPGLAALRLPLCPGAADRLPDRGGRRLQRRRLGDPRVEPFEPVNQYALQIDRFSRLLRGETAPSWPIEDALITLRVIEAIFESARDGAWRTVKGQ
jgi:predicted dehydrogenase